MVAPDEIALRSWHFKQLKWSLQALAIPASEQLRLFPEFVVKADELALDFDHWASVVRGSYLNELSKPQVDSLAAIDQMLTTMSRDGSEFDPELWTELGLAQTKQWNDVRKLAAGALEVFGWAVESPPPDPHDRGHSTYGEAG